jgi:hypothetical protein
MSDLETRVADLEARLDRLEPHVRRSMPLGPGIEREKELEAHRNKEMKTIVAGIRAKMANEPEKAIAPVDRSQMQLTDGSPVPPDRSHTDLKDNGQQKEYVVLTQEERAKGFVRPVRHTYIHVGNDPVMDGIVLIKAGRGSCGRRTTMNHAIAETYARDPKFYSGTFCVTCGVHRPLDEFIWEGTVEKVGS